LKLTFLTNWKWVQLFILSKEQTSDFRGTPAFHSKSKSSNIENIDVLAVKDLVPQIFQTPKTPELSIVTNFLILNVSRGSVRFFEKFDLKFAFYAFLYWILQKLKSRSQTWVKLMNLITAMFSFSIKVRVVLCCVY